MAANAAPAQAASNQAVRLVTANVEFSNSAAIIAQDFRQYSPHGDIIMLQEAKNVILHNLIDTSTWAVLQDTSSEDRRGSALVIRRSILNANTPISDFHLVKGVDASWCPGDQKGIMTRWMAVATLHLANGAWLVPTSLHMPPPRCQTGPGSPYDRMSDSVVNLSHAYPNRLTIGADWNKPVKSDPNDISARSGGHLLPRAPGDSVDGFMIPRHVWTNYASYLAPTHSDHRPVTVTLTIPPTF